MAQISPSALITSLKGKIDRNSLVVARVKKYRNPITGEVLGYGPNEYYVMRRRTKKPTWREIRARARFSNATHIAHQILEEPNSELYKKLWDMYINQLSAEKSIKIFQHFIVSKVYKKEI